MGGGTLPVLLMMKNKEESEMKGTEEEQQEQQLVVVPPMPYLDEDIITNILIKVRSAESLYNSLRYVSKLWSSIISHHPGIHLNSLLPNKPPCLIIQHRNKKLNNTCFRYQQIKPMEEVLEIMSNDLSYTTCLVNMGRKKEGVIQLEQQIIDVTPFFKKLYIRACCNGLILASTPSGIQNHETLYVINPLTNHRIVLPPRPIASRTHPVPFGFVFLPSIGKYKVVTSGHYCRRDLYYGRRDLGKLPHHFILVITISARGHGCDVGWRIIEAPISLILPPLTVNGIMYWGEHYLGKDHIGEHYLGKDHIVSFDVTTEKFYMIADHKLYRPIKCVRYGGFIDMGHYLGFWFFLPDENTVQSRTFNLLVLDDIHKMEGAKGGGAWKQLHSGVTMDIDFIKTRMGIPVSYIGNGEVMIFFNGPKGELWAYHFVSNRWLKLGNDLEEKDYIDFYGFHVNSKPVPFDTLYSFSRQTTW